MSEEAFMEMRLLVFKINYHSSECWCIRHLSPMMALKERSGELT